MALIQDKPRNTVSIMTALIQKTNAIDYLTLNFRSRLLFVLLYLIAAVNFSATSHQQNTDNAKKELPFISPLESTYITLLNQKEIQLAELEIYFQEGIAQEDAEPFDPILASQVENTQTQNFLIPTSDIRTHRGANETTGSASITKRSRTGTVFNANAEFDIVHNNYLFEKSGAISRTINRGKLTLQFVQPLLRGFMFSEDAMNEIASRIEVYARYYDSLQVMSQKVSDTLSNYWELVTAKKNLAIQIEAVKRLEKLTQDTQRLIDEGQLAANEINQPLKQLADQRLQKALAEQRVFAAYESLKFSMGMTSPCEVCVDKFNVLDDFPAVDIQINNLCEMLESWTRLSLDYNFNLIAARYRIEETKFVLKGATNALLPQLNLFGGVTRSNYSLGSRADRYYTSLEGRDPQYDSFIGLTFSTPLWNDGPQGLVKQATARNLQSITQEQFLTQSILRNLRTAVSNQIQILKELEQANIQVEKSRELVKNETIRLKAGISTLFFVVNFETLLTSSLLTQTELQRSYFQNITQIRFLTATLIELSEDKDQVIVQTIDKIPEFSRCANAQYKH
jgi:outer membrane protein TolC